MEFRRVLFRSDPAWTAAESPAPDSVVTPAMADGGTPAWLRELGVAAGMLAVVLAVAEGVARRRKRRRLSRASEVPPGDGAAVFDEGPPDGREPDRKSVV